MPFQPKGEIAQWRIVYGALREATVGQPVTYETLAGLLDVDPVEDRHRIQAAARRAGQQLLEVDDRAVEVVPDVGYRTVVAQRQIAMAGKQVDRASNMLDHGRALTTHIRMDELTPQEREVVHAMALGFAQVAEWARQIGRRIEDHEDRLADVEAELRRLREERGQAE